MQFQSIIVSECRLIKLRPCILFEKYIINILALQMASPGYRHCASCIGTLSFPVLTTPASTSLHNNVRTWLSCSNCCRDVTTFEIGLMKATCRAVPTRATSIRRPSEMNIACSNLLNLPITIWRARDTSCVSRERRNVVMFTTANFPS